MAASVWRGRITFGLVSIPVRLMKAARRERTRFRRVQRVRTGDVLADDDQDMTEVSAQPTRVLEFPSGGKNVAPFLGIRKTVHPSRMPLFAYVTSRSAGSQKRRFAERRS